MLEKKDQGGFYHLNLSGGDWIAKIEVLKENLASGGQAGLVICHEAFDV